MLRMRLFIGCLALCFIQQLYAGSLKVFTEVLPPYQYKDSSNQPTGYAVALVNEVLKEANLDSKIKVLPWVRAYKQALNEKNILLFSVIRSNDREEQFKWIGEIDQLEYALYGLSDRDELKVDTIQEARKYSIGTVKSSHGQSQFQQLGFRGLRSNNDYGRLLDMLHSKRFDLLLASKAPLEEVIKKSKYNRDDFEVVYEVSSINKPLYIVLSNNSDAELFEKLKQAYKNVVNSGLKDKLKKTWLSSND